MSGNTTRDHGELSAWRAGRLSERAPPKQLLFGRVYEDSAIERAVFAPSARVFCVASAGCTALALCRDHDVVACDINPAQIDYVRRRLQGAPRETGRADRLMGHLRALMPLAGFTRLKVLSFLSLDDPVAQASYFREQLDTWRFRTGLALLLSPLALSGWYSSALLRCLPRRFDRVLRARLLRGFERHPNRTNPYAWELFTGHAAPGDPEPVVPPGKEPELVVADAAAYLERCPVGSFGGFSLSNILDGAEDAYGRRLLAAVRNAARPGAIVVRRSFSEPAAALSENRAAEDRSLLWGVVDARPIEEVSATEPLTSPAGGI